MWLGTGARLALALRQNSFHPAAAALCFARRASSSGVANPLRARRFAPAEHQDTTGCCMRAHPSCTSSVCMLPNHACCHLVVAVTLDPTQGVTRVLRSDRHAAAACMVRAIPGLQHSSM